MKCGEDLFECGPVSRVKPHSMVMILQLYTLKSVRFQIGTPMKTVAVYRISLFAMY